MIFFRKVWLALRSTTVKAYIIKLAICVAAFMVAILFWWPAVWLVAGIACFFIAFEVNVKSIVYVLFFASFINNDRTDWISVIVAFFALVCIVLFIIKTSRKEKKESIFLGAAILAFLIYGGLTSIRTMTSLGVLDRYSYIVLHMVLLFFLFCLKKDLNFKNLAFFFIAGILTTSLIGAFVDVIPLLANSTIEFRSYGLTRFCGLTGNPNRYYMFVLAGISALFVLDLRKQISKKQFFPLLALLFALGISTISRACIIVMGIMLVAYITLKLTREKKAALKRVLVVGAVVLAVCLVLAPYTGANTQRLAGIPNTSDNQIISRPKPPRHEDRGTSPPLPPGHDDPGRAGIWERNLRDWVSSPLVFFFGRGFGSPNIGVMHQHNDIVFLLIKSGLVGLLLFILFWFTLFYTMFKVKKYKFCLVPFLFLLAFASIGMFELILPRIQGIIYVFFFIFCFAKAGAPAETPKPISTTEVNKPQETSI